MYWLRQFRIFNRQKQNRSVVYCYCCCFPRQKERVNLTILKVLLLFLHGETNEKYFTQDTILSPFWVRFWTRIQNWWSVFTRLFFDIFHFEKESKSRVEVRKTHRWSIYRSSLRRIRWLVCLSEKLMNLIHLSSQGHCLLFQVKHFLFSNWEIRREQRTISSSPSQPDKRQTRTSVMFSAELRHIFLLFPTKLGILCSRDLTLSPSH